MGRSKSNLEESDVADLLAMKGDFLLHREETADLRGEVDDLRKDIHSINLKQDTMVTVLDGVQKAVLTLSSQLSTMADVLKSLRSTEASSSAQPGKSSPDQPQHEVVTGERAMSEETRRRLVTEQEKTRMAAAQIPNHLAPIQKSTTTTYEKPVEYKPAPANQRAREPGKCWRCGDAWFHGHKCKLAPVLNVLTGEDPNEQAKEHEEMEEQEEAEQQPQEELCMTLSSQAMKSDNANTISILVQIGGKQGIALVDSGSNSTFMSLKFALSTNCTILKDTSRAVTVAGGGTLWSGSYVPPTTFTAGNTKFTQQFRVLDLAGHDIVLGSDWMEQHSPVAFHYNPRQISVMLDQQTPMTIKAWCDTQPPLAPSPSVPPLAPSPTVPPLALTRTARSPRSGRPRVAQPPLASSPLFLAFTEPTRSNREHTGW
ncbi:hypothetical protein D1007_00810 [Hordeum vulgare]|nr:hypothetical protein D1007_00810 [Hordeum vulgare]